MPHQNQPGRIGLAEGIRLVRTGAQDLCEQGHLMEVVRDHPVIGQQCSRCPNKMLCKHCGTAVWKGPEGYMCLVNCKGFRAAKA